MTTETKTTQKALVPKEEKAVITWQGRKITITFDDVKRSICPRATDQEAVVFLKMAHSLNLNPWERDIFMVKFGEEPASYIVASQAYQKAAETCPEFDGYEAGIFIEADGELKQREGAFLLEKEQSRLVGGWAKVYRKDRQRPFYSSVNIRECAKYTKDGRMTRFWASMPATMIRKVALARSLREAFPSRLGGMVSDAEYDEIPEGTLPPAFQKNGKTDWRKLYAKLRSELGVTPEQAHELIEAESFNDLLADGWTEDQIFGAIVTAQQRQRATEKEPEQIVDVQTGEIITQDEDLFGEGEKAGDAALAEAHKDEEPTSAAPPAKPKLDPATIKDVNQLLKACHDDFNLQPKQVYNELNVSGPMEITNVAEAYRRIAAIRG